MAKATKTQAVETPKVEAQTIVQPTVTEVQPIKHDYTKLMEELKSKSAVIRFLDSEGHTRGAIAKFMGIKYQFVRNVLITPVGKKTAA